MKKYELLEKEGEYYRIRALRDFRNVKKGDLGGLIQSELNLSHDGDCWVAENAQVSGDAEIYGSAMVSGDAEVYGNAMVSGYAEVYGNAKVSGYAEVYGNAKVCGDALVYGDALVCGNALVCRDALVCGNASMASVEKSKPFDFSILPDNVESIKIGGKTYEKHLTWVEV